MEPTPPAPPSGPPDEESRRALEQLDRALSKGRTRFFLEQILGWYVSFGVVLYFAGLNWNSGYALLWLCIAAAPVLIAYTLWVQAREAAERLRNGASIKQPAAMKDGKALTKIAATLLVLSIGILFMPARATTVLSVSAFTLIVVFVLSGWAFNCARKAALELPKGHMLETACKLSLLLNLGLLALSISQFVFVAKLFRLLP